MPPKKKAKKNAPVVVCDGCEEEAVDEPGDFCEMCTRENVDRCIMCFGKRCPLEKAIAVGCLKRPEQTPLCLACWLKHRGRCERCGEAGGNPSAELRREAEARVEEVLASLEHRSGK